MALGATYFDRSTSKKVAEAGQTLQEIDNELTAAALAGLLAKKAASQLDDLRGDGSLVANLGTERLHHFSLALRGYFAVVHKRRQNLVVS